MFDLAAGLKLTVRCSTPLNNLSLDVQLRITIFITINCYGYLIVSMHDKPIRIMLLSNIAISVATKLFSKLSYLVR